MGLVQLESIYQLLICPRCSSDLELTSKGIVCTAPTCVSSRSPFLQTNCMPILVDFDQSILEDQEYSIEGNNIRNLPSIWILKKVFSKITYQENQQAAVSVCQMMNTLRSQNNRENPRVLVVGGGSIGSGISKLYETTDLDIISFDIYESPNIQFIADAHRIPLKDGSIDAVVVQAVLEHVLEPTRVVQEIGRVLRYEGLVYSDTPFLQQVHEGPYDFTRFTESGHRYLFRDFECIDSGVVAGPATSLLWAIIYFVRSLTRSRIASAAARVIFSWLPRCDRFLDKQLSIDGANSVFFYGQIRGSRLPSSGIVKYYQGAGHNALQYRLTSESL